jgi:hypothetical protein
MKNLIKRMWFCIFFYPVSVQWAYDRILKLWENAALKWGPSSGPTPLTHAHPEAEISIKKIFSKIIKLHKDYD